MLTHIVPIEVLKWRTEFYFYFLVMSNTIQFEKGMKLRPRFIRPFRIKEKIGLGSYCLVLPPHLHKTHDFFFISVLLLSRRTAVICT